MCKQTDAEYFHKQIQCLIDPDFWRWNPQAFQSKLDGVLFMITEDEDDTLLAQAEIDVDLLILDWQSDIGKDYF